MFDRVTHSAHLKYIQTECDTNELKFKAETPKTEQFKTTNAKRHNEEGRERVLIHTQSRHQKRRLKKNVCEWIYTENEKRRHQE